MLSEKKIRYMIRLSEYESGNGKTDLYRTHFFKGDYIRFQILKSIVCTTIGMLLVFGLVALYKMDYIMINMMNLDYKLISFLAILVYLLVLFITIAITIHTSGKAYEESKVRVKFYQETLDDLKEFYEEEKDDTSAGTEN